MPSMGGSATLISAPHLGDLLDVDMSAKVDQSIPSWQASAGKYEPLPGVAGDDASGLVVQGGLMAGDSSGATLTGHELYGTTVLGAGQSVVDGNSNALYISLSGALGGPSRGRVGNLSRFLDRLTHPLYNGLLLLYNGDVSSPTNLAPAGELVIEQQRGDGSAALSVNDIGGLGLFGATPPTAQPAITGALSTVADAAAKDVLTSIIATLVGCGLASDGTT